MIPGVSCGSTRPLSSHSSAAMIPHPPPMVMMATRFVFGMGRSVRAADTFRSSDGVFTWTMPACANIAR
ncbi:MAG: hypothetical protein BWX71_00897 [Deltaproteobacteria bacterium ADurb.Bin072]|nr:MAG: hypothetical protein BWX71_00897 [Deltaproteobacteria bacterium ADurb.Bin072]